MTQPLVPEAATVAPEPIDPSSSPIGLDLDDDRAPDADVEQTCPADHEADATSRLLAEGLVLQRGEPEAWASTPIRSGLASAVIHAVMSPRLAPPIVETVVQRYEQRFGAGGGADDLAASFDTLGADGWQEQIGTRHRTAAALDAPYKSEIIQQAAAMLCAHGIHDAHLLIENVDDPVLRAAWCALPGQSSGFSWRHLLGAVGASQRRVCPLTRRFVRRWAGRAVADLPDDAVLHRLDLVTQRLDVPSERVADQAWRAATPRAFRVKP